MLSCSGRTEVHNLNLNHRWDILLLPCRTPPITSKQEAPEAHSFLPGSVCLRILSP